MSLISRFAAGACVLALVAACGYDAPVSPAGGPEGQVQLLLGGQAQNALATDLPRGSARVFATSGVPDSIRLTLDNIQGLESGVYKVWLVNRRTQTAVPLSGRLLRRSFAQNPTDSTRVDTTVHESVQSTSTFAGGPGTIIFTSQSYQAAGGQAGAADSLAFLLITREADQATAAPSLTQPLWARVLGATNVTLSFGDFNFKDAADTVARVFSPQGSMRGGVLGDTVAVSGQAQFVGSRLEVVFRGLRRPPQGYEYRAYLCGTTDTTRANVGQCRPTDPKAFFLDLGLPTGPGGESLADADITANTGNVVGTRINDAILVFDFAEQSVTGAPATICDYDRLRVALQPKGAANRVGAFVFDVPLPDLIRNASSCR